MYCLTFERIKTRGSKFAHRLIITDRAGIVIDVIEAYGKRALQVWAIEKLTG